MNLGCYYKDLNVTLIIKYRNYFALWKYTAEISSQRLLCPVVLPSAAWNLLPWFWNSCSGSHTKSLQRRKKRDCFSFKDLDGKLNMLLSFTFTGPNLVSGHMGLQGITGNIICTCINEFRGTYQFSISAWKAVDITKHCCPYMWIKHMEERCTNNCKIHNWLWRLSTKEKLRILLVYFLFCLHVEMIIVDTGR